MKPRLFLRNRIMLLGDLIIIVISALGSFALRTDLGPLFNFYLTQALWLVAIALMVKPLVYYFYGLYRRMWIYASTRELRLIVAAVSTASVIISLVIVILRAVEILPFFPRSTLLIDWLLSLVLVGGFRFALRILNETQQVTVVPQKGTRRVLVVGAGDAGALVVREMQKNTQLGLKPVCFLDDDPTKLKQQIHGIPVLGDLGDLTRLVVIKGIHEVIIAIPSAAR